MIVTFVKYVNLYYEMKFCIEKKDATFITVTKLLFLIVIIIIMVIIQVIVIKV